jgi:hypothetical protein
VRSCDAKKIDKNFLLLFFKKEELSLELQIGTPSVRFYPLGKNGKETGDDAN